MVLNLLIKTRGISSQNTQYPMASSSLPARLEPWKYPSRNYDGWSKSRWSIYRMEWGRERFLTNSWMYLRWMVCRQLSYLPASLDCREEKTSLGDTSNSTLDRVLQSMGRVLLLRTRGILAFGRLFILEVFYSDSVLQSSKGYAQNCWLANQPATVSNRYLVRNPQPKSTFPHQVQVKQLWPIWSILISNIIIPILMQNMSLQGQIYQAYLGIADRQKNYSQLNRMIEKVFSSPELLNDSYRVFVNKKAQPNNHNMDIAGVEVFYQDMSKNRTNINNGFQSILQSFFKAVPSYIELDTFVKEGDHSYNNLRLILIVIFCPMVYDQGYRAPFIKLTNIIHPMKADHKECLAKWLCSMSASQLQGIVRYIQEALSSQTIKLLPQNMQKNDPKSIAHLIDIFCTFLAILNRSNQLKKRLSIQAFRNPQIMKYFHHEQQYRFFKKNINILNFIRFPFLFDIHYKLKLLDFENKDEQHSKMEEGMMTLIQAQLAHNNNQPVQLNTADLNSLYLQVRVHRNSILIDSMNLLMHVKGLKNPMKVKFIDELGDDGGGVKKEYFQMLVKQIFDPNMDMFATKNNDRFHWFNGLSFESPQMFEFAGLILGLSIYNGTMLDLKFPKLVYKKLLQKDNQLVDELEDLQQIEPDLYKGFKYILETTEPLESMEMYFAAEVIQFDARVVIPLKGMGERIRVTQYNKIEYVREYSKWIVNKFIQAQFQAFKTGFYKVVTGSMIKLFSPEELQKIICGSEIVNLEQLKSAVKYEGGFTQNSYIVRALWETLAEFNIQQKKVFLFFTTGSDRAPIGGLSKLKFTIQRHGPDTENVPTSHTCSNVLLLPDYSSKDKLKKKLLIGLNHSQGFGLI